MTLKDLISQVPNWQTASASQVLACLAEKTIPYVDNSDWTWKGISGVLNQDTGERFGREGCKRLQDALLAAGEGLWVSQISAGMPLTDFEIQGVLRNLDSTGVVPGARFIADAVSRQISVLEKYTITTTIEEIAQVQAAMKHAERKARLKTAGANQYNQFCNAVDNLQPDDPDPVL